MEVYDKLRVTWVPYLMFFNQPNFRSSVVNTDSRGFRFSGMMGEGDNLTKSKSVNVFSGGSAAFGIGSTSDKNTIPSLLNGKNGSVMDELWGKSPYLYSGVDIICIQQRYDKWDK